MAKSNKRKAIRTRGNNLKRTVRRGRKLNRAVNHVKATKKRRKSRSRRTSRKVRKSLNQSGGLAGTAQQAIALFNQIFSIDGDDTNVYEQIKSIKSIFSDTITISSKLSKFMPVPKQKQYLFLLNKLTGNAIKFRYHYSCIGSNESLKCYLLESANKGSIKFEKKIPTGLSADAQAEKFLPLYIFDKNPIQPAGYDSKLSVDDSDIDEKKNMVLEHLGIDGTNFTLLDAEQRDKNIIYAVEDAEGNPVEVVEVTAPAVPDRPTCTGNPIDDLSYRELREQFLTDDNIKSIIEKHPKRIRSIKDIYIENPYSQAESDIPTINTIADAHKVFIEYEISSPNEPEIGNFMLLKINNNVYISYRHQLANTASSIATKNIHEIFEIIDNVVKVSIANFVKNVTPEDQATSSEYTPQTGKTLLFGPDDVRYEIEMDDSMITPDGKKKKYPARGLGPDALYSGVTVVSNA